VLENGVNPDLPDRYGKTPLYQAGAFNETRAVELLLVHHADPNIQGNTRRTEFPVTPLQYAAYMGNLRIASMLIGAGAHIGKKGPTGRTALQFAVLGIHLDVIRYLLGKGADLNTRDTEGASPLDDAVWRGALDATAILAIAEDESVLVEALLRHGARANTGLPLGLTPLDAAVSAEAIKAARFIEQ
jgi:ankyrin repeat protein